MHSCGFTIKIKMNYPKINCLVPSDHDLVMFALCHC